MEYPPLLSVGFHPLTIAQLRMLCVDQFPGSVSRAPIMQGLEKFLATLHATGLTAVVWIDGSFLTEKPEPADVDVVLCITRATLTAMTLEQEAAIDWINSLDPRSSCHCDSYCYYDDGSPESEWDRAYWIRQFGFDRDTEMKGIAKIALPLGT